MEEKLAKLTKLISEIEDPKAKAAIEVIYEILDDVTNEIDDINDDLDSIDEALQMFDADLAEVEDAIFADDDDEEDCDGDCSGCAGCGVEEPEEPEELEVPCPNCGTLILIESMDVETVTCPQCKVTFGVDYEYDTEDFDV